MKPLFLLIPLLILLHFHAEAQRPPSANQGLRSQSCANDLFVHVFNSPNFDLIADAMVDAGNDTYIASAFVYKKDPLDMADGLLFKLNTAGVKEWEINIGGPGSQHINSLIKTKDGNFIAFASGQDVSNGFSLVKFDGNGNIIWRKHFDNNTWAWDEPNLREDSDGSLIITFRIVENLLSFNDRIYFCKLDANANMLFSRIFYNDKYFINTIYVRDLYVKDGFSYILASYRTYYQMEGLLMKVNNSNGNIEWTKLYDFNGGPMEFSEIFPFKGDKFCITGTSSNDGEKTSMVLICDSRGQLESMKYFTTGQSSTRGVSSLNNKGMLTRIQNYYESYDDVKTMLSTIDPENGFIWSKLYPSLDKPGRPTSVLFNANEDIIVYGNNILDNFRLCDLYFIRMNKDGELGCPSTAFTIEMKNGTSVPDNIVLANRIFPTVSIPEPLVKNSDYIQYKETSCYEKTSCTSIEISGNQKICHVLDTVSLDITRNIECRSDPVFNYDHNYFEFIDFSSTKTRFRSLKPGVSKITASIENSCGIISSELTIQIMNNPALLDLGRDTMICTNNVLTLKADIRFEHFKWQDNSTNAYYYVKRPGTYYVEAIDSCGNIYSDTILVTEKPAYPLDLGTDLAICSSDTVTILAPAGFLNYSWKNNYSISAVTGQSIKVYPSVDTSYYLSAEKTPGCFSFDTIKVKVHNRAPISLQGDTSICAGDRLQLKPNPGFVTYSWNTGETAQNINVDKAAVYMLAATNANGCISRDTFRLKEVFDLPVIAINKDPWLCTGNSKTLFAGNGFASYRWNTANTSASIEVKDLGQYWVEVTDNHKCKKSDTVVITEIKMLPHDFLPPDSSICKYGKLTISANANFSSYSWSTGEKSNKVTFNNAGTYLLTVRDKYGCEGKDSIKLKSIDCLSGIFFPNAFSPNADGKNDIFKPIVYATPTFYEFSIYNRWGTKVFGTTDKDKGWNGTLNGQLQDGGTFVWTCTYQINNDAVKVEKGTLQLVR